MSGTPGQAPPATPPAGDAPPAQTPPTPPPTTPPAGDPQTFDLAYVQQLRQEAATHRTAKAAAEAELKKLTDSQLSDQEKLANRAKELEKEVSDRAMELRQERANRQVEQAARKLNIVDEETALALISGKIEFDADGKPTNIERLLTDLIKAKPFLVGSEGGGAPGNPGNPAGGRGTVFTADHFKGKSPEYINAHWDDYVKAQANK